MHNKTKYCRIIQQEGTCFTCPTSNICSSEVCTEYGFMANKFRFRCCINFTDIYNFGRVATFFTNCLLLMHVVSAIRTSIRKTTELVGANMIEIYKKFFFIFICGKYFYTIEKKIKSNCHRLKKYLHQFDVRRL